MKLLKFILCLFLISIITIPVSADEEEENENDMLCIEVNINELNLHDIVVNELLDEGDITHIDLEHSTLTLDKVSTTTMGDHLVHAFIEVKYNDPEYLDTTISKLINIKVVDTIAPVLALSQNDVSICTGDEFDPYSYVTTLSDNANTEPVLTISDNYDINTEGVYEIEYKASDESNNETIETLTLHVSDISSLATFAGSEINEMLTLINAFRAENGLDPYTLGPENAQKAVGLRAYESLNDISHVRPDGSHYKTALDQFGVSYSTGPLEILTYSGSTVQDKLNWWKNSSGHRAILLASGYQYIAIAHSGEMWCAIVY